MSTNICEEFAGVWQYADDVALVASSPSELQNMIKHLQTYCRDCALIINLHKTKIVEFKNQDQPSCSYTATTQDQTETPIQVVPSFPYLGLPLDYDLSMKSAMSSARGSFWGAHHSACWLGMTAAGLDIQE
jgi:hypothetical protein